MNFRRILGILHATERPTGASRLTVARKTRATLSRAQRALAWTATLLVGLLAAAPRSGAQDTSAKTRADSMAERMEALERSVKLLREQLQAQAASGVQSKSRSPIEFSGRILLSSFINSGRSNNLDVPTVAVASVSPGQDRSAGATMRQTILALSAQGAKLWGADASGFIEADFFGGLQQGAGGRRLFPEPRLRIARAMLTWPGAELMVGQDVPLLAPIEPVGIAQLGSPSFAVAGNLWFWLPQVRATFNLGESGPVRWALQAAVVAPWSGGDVVPGDVDVADIGERQRAPMLQARLRARWGEDDLRGEIGFAGHVGWLGTAADTSLMSSAIALSWQVPMASWVELRGEAYVGQMLRGLGGGGAGQNFGASASGAPIPLHDTGGWLQLNLKPDASWTLGVGAGSSQPDVADRPVRSRNDAFETHAIWRPGGLPIIGLEFREIQTTYRATGLARTRQVNLTLGVEF